MRPRARQRTKPSETCDETCDVGKGSMIAASGYVVVVNAANAVTELYADVVAQLFLRQMTRWPSGVAVIPLDQIEGSSAREAFSRDVLRKSVDEVKAYWETQLFSAQAIPPLELPSDDVVLGFVRANVGAIGYVSAGIPLGPGVRALGIGG